MLGVLVGCGTDVPNTAQCDGSAEVLYRGKVWGANLAVADGTVYFATSDYSTSADPHSVMATSTTCGTPTLVTDGTSVYAADLNSAYELPPAS